MPGGDRSGPAGMGPGTGRRMGYCSGYDQPGVFNRGFGFGMGRGGGRGNRNRFFATGTSFRATFEPSPDWEMNSLKAQADALKNELQAIEKRLESFNQDSKKESEG